MAHLIILQDKLLTNSALGFVITHNGVDITGMVVSVTTTDPSDSGLSEEAEIGISVGASAFVIILIVGVVYFMRYKRTVTISERYPLMFDGWHA